ncbi:hypothetical protein NDU88_012874 [Pleurodeles waltl]|uniref:Uncharacterized protein n=1 Tax=Pleurodeles waltl TaxID=8319 RepID=A0AAV7R1C7_PLEWA|nr:hypothetical protein NDU88_012874 [Pleurodeles waltl]
MQVSGLVAGGVRVCCRLYLSVLPRIEGHRVYGGLGVSVRCVSESYSVWRPQGPRVYGALKLGLVCLGVGVSQGRCVSASALRGGRSTAWAPWGTCGWVKSGAPGRCRDARWDAGMPWMDAAGRCRDARWDAGMPWMNAAVGCRDARWDAWMPWMDAAVGCRDARWDAWMPWMDAAGRCRDALWDAGFLWVTLECSDAAVSDPVSDRTTPVGGRGATGILS